jgi:RNA recognition motif-containing protein
MKNIFVGNLSYDATEHTLRSLFEQYGTVERASVVTDRDTGRAKGFGFVEMSVNAEAERAIAELNGQEVDGRALNVNEARPREERGGFGGGGQRRGGYGGGGGAGGQRRNRY